MPRPTKRSSLACLTKKRLITLARAFELATPQAEPKDTFVDALAEARAATLAAILDALPLAELRSICTAHELPTSGTKPVVIARILGDDRPTEPKTKQTSLLPEPEPKPEPELAAVVARAQPSVAGILPLLQPTELTALRRRLAEQHNLPTDLDPTTLELPLLLSELDRDQLFRIATRYALRPRSRAAEALIRTILAAAAGVTEDEALEVLPRGVFTRVEPNFDPGELPNPGELVRARHRQYLVAEVIRPTSTNRNPKTGLQPSTLVKLVCLDDDAQGQPLDVFWELEVGATRIDPTRQSLGSATHFDPAPEFGAYYHALRWNCVTTATSPEDERIQAPFRAGIAVMQHQLVPLQKVLALPRANLFIADDVGLGKTIEAGLILQELRLRQRLDMILILCPASICLQWQTEMERRFGLRFEIINREHIAKIRRERGVGTNRWECGRRLVGHVARPRADVVVAATSSVRCSPGRPRDRQQ